MQLLASGPQDPRHEMVRTRNFLWYRARTWVCHGPSLPLLEWLRELHRFAAQDPEPSRLLSWVVRVVGSRGPEQVGSLMRLPKAQNGNSENERKKPTSHSILEFFPDCRAGPLFLYWSYNRRSSHTKGITQKAVSSILFRCVLPGCTSDVGVSV